MDDTKELFTVIKEVIEKLNGPDTDFLIIIPSKQQVATSLNPDQVPPLLATITASMLNKNAFIREHIDEDGEEHKDTMN